MIGRLVCRVIGHNWTEWYGGIYETYTTIYRADGTTDVTWGTANGRQRVCTRCERWQEKVDQRSIANAQP